MALKFLPRTPGRPARDMDPLAGVANLFDASIVLIVAMMMALFMSFALQEFLDGDAQVTITRTTASGEVEVITRQGTEIKVQRVTTEERSGAGVRLGTAFQLENGQIVYVPE